MPEDISAIDRQVQFMKKPELTIKGTTGILGLMGDPVEHSLSPLMHNKVLQTLAFDFTYVPFPVTPANLEPAIRAIPALGIRGVNLTIPHKEKAIPYLDKLSREAELTGAVNTILNTRGKLTGYNTDGPGFVRSLREERGFHPKGQHIIILGAGGAARAIAVQLGLEEAGAITIANRREEKAQRLCSWVQEKTGVLSEGVGLNSPRFLQLLAGAQLLVQATSYGMFPHHKVPPLIPPAFLHSQLLVCDIVYNPRETSLLKAAKDKGCSTLNGLGMLAYQGAGALEIWLEVQAPVELMKSTLQENIS